MQSHDWQKGVVMVLRWPRWPPINVCFLRASAQELLAWLLRGQGGGVTSG